MATFIKSMPNIILLQCYREKKSWAICLFFSVFVITLLSMHQMYSHESTPLLHIQATNTVTSSVAAKGSPSIHVRSENVSETLELVRLSRSLQQNTSQTQQIQLNIEVSKALPTLRPLSSDSCPTVHIVMIIVSYNQSRSAFLTIKSILMYRQTKLHFHFITDSTGLAILEPMMSSWLLPGVEFDFYNITEAWSSTPWRVSQLCSKELLKIAALHLVLPHEIDAVIVADPNVIITANVFDMFSQTIKDLGRKGRLIALSSSECTVECNTTSVIQRNKMYTNYNTLGVMVVSLAGMRRSVSWKKLWQGLRKEPPDCKQVSSVTTLDSVREVCVTLKCDWNTHRYLLSSTPDDCWANISVFEQDFKSNALRKVLQHIQNYDGYRLRFKQNDKCYHSFPELKKPSSSAIKKDKCIMLKWEGAAKRRMYPYFLGSKFTISDPHDVTLTSHMSFERLYLIEIASKHWDGPMSLAIEVTDSQMQQVFDFVSKSELLSQRNNIAYHLLLKISPSYAVNPLRILGHKYVTTPYAFFNDIDFIPSYSLYENLKDTICNISTMNKTALVVPAFETNNSEMSYPRNKEEIVSLMKRNLVWQFHKHWSPGHAPTNYKKWAHSTTTSLYTVTWKQHYEPYIAVETSVLFADPRFVSRYYNKVAFLEEVHMAGYHFKVVPDGFLIHMPHPLVNRSVLYPEACYRSMYMKWKQEKQKQYKKH